MIASILKHGHALIVAACMACLTLTATVAPAQPSASDTAKAVEQAVTKAASQASHAGGEANLVLPRVGGVSFMGIAGDTLLYGGLAVSALGMLFGLVIYAQLKGLPVHKSMLDISELIYATCKSYMIQQGKFLMILWAFIAVAVAWYFGWLIPNPEGGSGMSMGKVALILAFSLVGIAGSYGVAWFGIRVNTFANSRAAFASLKGKPFPCYAIPLKAGMSIGMALISVELLIMLGILLFVPGDVSGACLIGFAIGESLGASALRIAGGIFTKIADIGSDLMKIVFKIKEDDARNPGVIADCVGDNAGDSVGPSADGFETYGVTGVALISFILLAINKDTAGTDFATVQIQLLVWLFVMRIIMVIASAGSYFINEMIAKAKYANADKFNYEHPLTSLVVLTSVVSVALTFIASYFLIPEIAGGKDWWWQLSLIITCGTAAGAIIPELVKVFTSTHSRHVREVVTASEQGGASLNILSGLVAGNFSCYWLGMAIVALMGGAYYVSTMFMHTHANGDTIMMAPAVFAFGLVAFGFLGMGPVTIAVDSYGPVTDNAQSVYELSTIESLPNIKGEIQKDYGFVPEFEKAKEALEENDGAGNTFKATAKPVLIGTAVVGATTMIFAIVVALTHGLEPAYLKNLSILHPPFLLGLITGGAIIYWFTGSSTQAVSTGAYRAVEFIKANIKLEGSTKASVEDSQKVVTICTQYAQKGMFNIFLGVFFATLAFAFYESFFFIGYLVSIALFGLYQAIFMANAGGAWDNAKKVVETELRKKGTDLHAATVVGDTVGDPFKDTSSVAMNPVIKFTTLFGLLAVELAVNMKKVIIDGKEHIEHTGLTTALTLGFLAISAFFIYRSFYGMMIGGSAMPAKAH
ncbi:MAG: K(+)-insensitive pyrophosphate-energized proton pump [Phycisphaerae bacterium]|nr:MAG: K(+)-insensitive pyrophosphate-energized proton pump [Phycisphaerae bacterium]